MARLSISQAAREWGIARSTLQRAIQAGRVSLQPTENGIKHIDSSEMLRVYGEALHAARDRALHPNATGGVAQKNDPDLEILKIHYTYLKRERNELAERLKNCENDLAKKEQLIERQREAMMQMFNARLPSPNE